MNKYDVTIGIPVYNAEKYIRKTLESALSQTFANIEFLILDDRGTDNSIEVIEDIKREHPRGKDIRIVSQPKNMGVAQARNRIIDEAQGRYLYFMDSDDVISDNCISLLYSNILEHQAEVVFGSYEKVELFKNESEPILYQYPNVCLFGDGKLAEFSYRCYGGIQASACNYLVSVDLLRKNNLKFINSRYWEDMVFTFELVTHVSRAVMLSDITYSYLCRDNSLSNYQVRNKIDKSEILNNVSTVDVLKRNTRNLLGKPYLGNRCYNIVMTDFYIICNVLKNKKIITPEIIDRELKSFLSHPLRLKEIVSLKGGVAKNFFLYTLGKLPVFAFIPVIKMIGRKKHLL